jgi:hypothetical protein
MVAQATSNDRQKRFFSTLRLTVVGKGQYRRQPKNSHSSIVNFLAPLAVVALIATGCKAAVDATLTGIKKVKHHHSHGKTTVTPLSPSTGSLSAASWAPVSWISGTVAIDQTTVTTSLGASVKLVRFHTHYLNFDLHDGSSDPAANGITIGPDSQSVIGPDEAPFLLAAFNGGFKMKTHVGGVEIDRQVLSPLIDGMESFVIDSDGAVHVGTWGEGLPLSGEIVQSVRQNLPPMISAGVESATIGNIPAWGNMLGPGPSVPRSALGQNVRGDLIYAAGMSLTPSDLASALMDAGVVNAMELDINPAWVQADAATSPGGTLMALVPKQNRPPDQYRKGWTRDFIAVMAKY